MTKFHPAISWDRVTAYPFFMYHPFKDMRQNFSLRIPFLYINMWTFLNHEFAAVSSIDSI